MALLRRGVVTEDWDTAVADQPTCRGRPNGVHVLYRRDVALHNAVLWARFWALRADGSSMAGIGDRVGMATVALFGSTMARALPLRPPGVAMANPHLRSCGTDHATPGRTASFPVVARCFASTIGYGDRRRFSE